MVLNNVFLAIPGYGSIIIIAVIVLLLFGGKKIPELMRGMGRGVKEFKEGVSDAEDALKDTDSEKQIKE